MTMQAGMTKVNEIFFHGAVNRTLQEVFPVVAPVPELHLLLRDAVGLHPGLEGRPIPGSSRRPRSIASSPSA